MIDRHWFVLIIGLIGSFSPRLAFALLFAYMAFVLLVQNNYIAL